MAFELKLSKRKDIHDHSLLLELVCLSDNFVFTTVRFFLPLKWADNILENAKCLFNRVKVCFESIFMFFI